MPASVQIIQECFYIQGPDVVPLISEDNAHVPRVHSPVVEDDQIVDLIPYRRNNFLLAIFLLGCLLTGGLLFVVLQWLPKYYFLARHSRVDSAAEATHFMIISPDKAVTFVGFKKITPTSAFNSTHISNRKPETPVLSKQASAPGFAALSHSAAPSMQADLEPNTTDYVKDMAAPHPGLDDTRNDDDSNEIEYFSSVNANTEIPVHESSNHDSTDGTDSDHDGAPHCGDFSSRKTRSSSHKSLKATAVTAPVITDLAAIRLDEDSFSPQKGLHAADMDPHAAVHYFIYRHVRYVFNPKNNTFLLTNGLVQPDEVVNVPSRIVSAGLSMPEYMNNLAYFGLNSLDIKVLSILRILIDRCLYFFYVFQVFSIGVWFYDEYYTYASAISVVTVLSIALDVYETRSNLQKLRKMAFFYEEVTVLRNGLEYVIRSLDLVPGDVYYLPKAASFSIPCDSLLLEGSCIVNESMLTGESAAVPKLALTPDPSTNLLTFKPLDDTRCIVYCGTKLVQVRGRVKAMVLSTGFSSKKGNLVRSILFAKEDNFKFYSDANKFVIGLFVISMLASVYSFILFGTRGVNTTEIIQSSLDIITIVVPPALPACVALGTMFAIYRLKLSSIFCIHPSKVNVAGMINCFVFDKTGTLTEDGLTVWGVSSSVKASSSTQEGEDDSYVFDSNKNVKNAVAQSEEDSSSMATTISTKLEDTAKILGQNNTTGNSSLLDTPQPISSTPNANASISTSQYQHELPDYMTYAMATCHSLSIINGDLVGDVVDLKMFESINWGYFDPHRYDDHHHDVDLDGSDDSENQDESSSKSSSEPSPYIIHDAHALQLDASVDPEVYQNIVSSPNMTQFGLLKTYPFSSALQRMSVTVQDLKSKRVLCFLKGSPEMVYDLCIKDNRLPKDYQKQLDNYTSSGYRILALAGKEILMNDENGNHLSIKSLQNLSRDTVEKDFQFYGFLILQNKLKPETKSAISHLKSADIRTIMCTGDNILTSIVVAKDSHIISNKAPVYMGRLAQNQDSKIDEETVEWFNVHDTNQRISSSLIGGPTINGRPYALAITGKAFTVIEKTDPELFEKLLLRVDIYSRMSPDHKTHLINSLKAMNYYVGMCGDGANDCGALTAADIGLSLSAEEASIAAPFTYRKPNVHIGACIKLIREGRASLSSTFSVFKFMALYAFVQLATAVILYYDNVNLGDYQYLYVDLIVIFPVSTSMGYTGAYSKLTKDRFIGTLLSPYMLTTMALLIVIQVIFQTSIYYLWLKKQDWYERFYDPAIGGNEVSTMSQENTVLFLATIFQYIGCAIAVNTGKPFRKPSYTNLFFVAMVLFYISFQTYMLFGASENLRATFELVHNIYDSWIIYVVGVSCCILTVFTEHFVFASRYFKDLFIRFTPGYNKERHYVLMKQLNELKEEA